MSQVIWHDNILPRLGPWIKPFLRCYWIVSRGMTLGVRCAAFDPDGRVFLVKHTYVSGWHLPGGGVEIGETLVDALEKELLEEANIVLRKPAEFFGFYYNKDAFRRDHVALFVTREWQQAGQPQPNAEIAGHGWFDPDALPAGTTVSTRRRIAEITSNAPPDAIW